MNHDLVPIIMFLCFTYAFKVVVDSRTRRTMLRSGGSEELLRSILQGEEAQRRYASLRWSLILIALAAGFGAIQYFEWRDVTPGVIAVLAAATGIGNLAFFVISRRLG